MSEPFSERSLQLGLDIFRLVAMEPDRSVQIDALAVGANLVLREPKEAPGTMDRIREEADRDG
jgi:hypothetical protein